ncbi:MAG: hypothetical protein AAGD01_00945 [Acidobacteriota bacterium]
MFDPNAFAGDPIPLFCAITCGLLIATLPVGAWALMHSTRAFGFEEVSFSYPVFLGFYLIILSITLFISTLAALPFSIIPVIGRAMGFPFGYLFGFGAGAAFVSMAFRGTYRKSFGVLVLAAGIQLLTAIVIYTVFALITGYSSPMAS